MEKIGQFSIAHISEKRPKTSFFGWSHLGAHDVIMTSHCRFSTLDSSGLHILLEEYINYFEAVPILIK